MRITYFIKTPDINDKSHQMHAYMMEIEPVAHIRTDFREKFGIPRQSCYVEGSEGTIVFTPKYRNPDALKGLEGAEADAEILVAKAIEALADLPWDHSFFDTLAQRSLKRRN